jgi:N-acetylglucosaminyldiphosphoundecaprenol N-acetyl-beta-D-mannosaminyltransferase
MAMETIKILNINIGNYTFSGLLSELRKGIVYTPNVDHLIRLQNDREFYKVYKEATHLCVDSKIVMLAARFLGTPFREQIAGSDFFPRFCQYHSGNNEIRVFLLGGSQSGTARIAMEKTNRRVGRTVVVGCYYPPFGFENMKEESTKILEAVRSTKANVLAVGVGAPKQEKWISRHKDQLTGVDLFIGVGATIDFMAGHLQRAPKIFIGLGLEWLYRLFKEPRRLWKRYLLEDIPFFWLIGKQKFGKYISPF